jgi:hypothetical protein
MWFKSLDDGRHYNSDNVVHFFVSGSNIAFRTTDGSVQLHNSSGTPYADPTAAEEALVALLGSFSSE